MGFNCTFAIALGDVTDEQLALLNLQAMGEEVTLDETSRGSAGLGVGVARLGDFTVMTEASLCFAEILDDPALVRGTWFITVSSSVTSTYEYRVIRDGSVVRSISLDEEGELTESGEPVGDESGFNRSLSESHEYYDGEDLLWILPDTSGLAKTHPGKDIFEMTGQRYDFPDELPQFTPVTDLGPAESDRVGTSRPWWKFWG